jgi:hypothetical protein
VQDLGGHRIEEGLGELGLVVLDQQADGVQLDLVPGIARQLGRAELALQPLHRLVDAQVVVGDAVALRVELALPVGPLEARLGAARRRGEQPVVAIEAFDDRARDREGLRIVQLVREHGVARGPQTMGRCRSFSASSARW